MYEELDAKVGDEVLYTYYSVGKITEKIVKVTRITPTGRIRIDLKDWQFDKYGRLMRELSIGNHCSIRKLTDEDRKRIVVKDTVNRAWSLLKETKLTYEQAKKIIEILEGSEDDGK